MLKILFFTLVSFGSDSVRTEVINGKTFIIHKVEAKETLFSISRKYGVALLGVVESNPGADSGLEIGQEIKVPYSPNNRTKTKEGTIHRVGQKETLYSIAKQYSVTVDDLKQWNNLSNAGLKLGQELIIKDRVASASSTETKVSETKTVGRHTVAAGETMYAITRKYGITVSQLKDWNGLTSNELKPGQEIIIAAPRQQTVVTNQTVNATETKIEQPVPVADNRKSTTIENTIPVTTGIVGTDETRESGMATLMPGDDTGRKYLVYHRSVKSGTIIRIKNSLTRQEIFARVIGNLPASESPDVLLQISKAGYEKLGASPGKFSVEVTYFK